MSYYKCQFTASLVELLMFKTNCMSMEGQKERLDYKKNDETKTVLILNHLNDGSFVTVL